MEQYEKYMRDKSVWNFEHSATQLDYQYLGNFYVPDRITREFVNANSVKWDWSIIENSDTSLDKGPLERALNTKLVANNLAKIKEERDEFVLYRGRIPDADWINTIAKEQNLKDYNIRLLCQPPGKMTQLHIDSFYYYKSDGKNIPIQPTDKNIKRIIVMISNWEFGQIFMFGNSTYTHWKRGDTITWDAQNVPHGAANFGWHDRISIVITGMLDCI